MPNPFASIAGFGVTFTTIFKKKTTEFYPEEKRPTAPRFHGRHQLNRHPDGLEKCVGCELCAWACPADAIYVEGADNTDQERYSPGERYGVVYQINYARCILCGLCIEACPTRALTMTNEYELAEGSREKLIYTKDMLLAPLAEGMLAPPHPMQPGTTETDYYHGKVTHNVLGDIVQDSEPPQGAPPDSASPGGTSSGGASTDGTSADASSAAGAASAGESTGASSTGGAR